MILLCILIYGWSYPRIFLFTSKIMLNDVKSFLINFHVLMRLQELYLVQT